MEQINKTMEYFVTFKEFQAKVKDLNEWMDIWDMIGYMVFIKEDFELNNFNSVNFVKGRLEDFINDVLKHESWEFLKTISSNKDLYLIKQRIICLMELHEIYTERRLQPGGEEYLHAKQRFEQSLKTIDQ